MTLVGGGVDGHGSVAITSLPHCLPPLTMHVVVGEPKLHLTASDNLLAAARVLTAPPAGRMCIKPCGRQPEYPPRLSQTSHCPSARVSHSSLVDPTSLFTTVMRFFIVFMKLALFLSFTTYAFAAPVKFLNVLVRIP